MCSITENLSNAKKIEWDKQIQKGEKVTVNPYMIAIIDDMTKMYKVLYHILPQQSIEAIFSEVFRHLMRTFDAFYCNSS